MSKPEKLKTPENTNIVPRQIGFDELGAALVVNNRQVIFALAGAIKDDDTTGHFMVTKMSELGYLYGAIKDSAKQFWAEGDSKMEELLRTSAKLRLTAAEEGIIKSINILKPKSIPDIMSLRVHMKRQIKDGGYEPIFYDINPYKIEGEPKANANISELLILKY